MGALFVIEDRDRFGGVGLARSGLSRADADRICKRLSETYPDHRYRVEPQKMTGRGKSRRVEYPAP